MPSRCLKAKNIQGLCHMNTHQGLGSVINPLWSLHHLQTSNVHFKMISFSVFMKQNTRKLNLCSKTDISKTAWLNAWNRILNFHGYPQIKRSEKSCFQMRSNIPYWKISIFTVQMCEVSFIFIVLDVKTALENLKLVILERLELQIFFDPSQP